MNFEEIKIKLDESYINVIKFGCGSKNMVIISGISLCGLEGQGKTIADAYKIFADEYRVFLFERKKDLSKNYAIDTMADDIYNAMNKLNIKSAYFYGVSQGGMIAQKLAVKHPQAVKKLALCSTVCRVNKTITNVLNNWIKYAEICDVVSLNRQFAKDVYSKDYRMRFKDVFLQLENIGTYDDCIRFCILAKSIFAFDIYKQVNNIKCPVFVLGSEKDGVIGKDGILEIANKLKCSSFIYKQYGHAVYDEAPDIKNRIKNFFDEY